MIFSGVSQFVHLLLLLGIGVVLVTALPQREEVGPDSKKFVPPANRVIIGYRTVSKDVAKRYNEFNRIEPFVPAHDMLGPGVYMTPKRKQFRRDHSDESFCVIAAYPGAFNSIEKIWIPPTGCDGEYLYDRLGKRQADHDAINEFILDQGGNPPMTVRLSRTDVYLTREQNIIQMSLSEGLVTLEQQRKLGIWVKCTKYGSDIPIDKVNVQKWENVIWTPEEELPTKKKSKGKKEGKKQKDGCECM